MIESLLKYKAKHVLFVVFLISRVLKSVLWWIGCSNYKRWLREPNYVKKDCNMMLFLLGQSYVTYIAGWWSILFYTLPLTFLIILYFWNYGKL